jgi:hypothetical protein
MIENAKALTGEANRISLISAGRVATLEDYPVIAERRIPVTTMEQGWTFEVEKKTPAGRTTPRLVSTLAEIINWLSHPGSGRINDRCLESRRNIYDSLTINRIRF